MFQVRKIREGWFISPKNYWLRSDVKESTCSSGDPEVLALSGKIAWLPASILSDSMDREPVDYNILGSQSQAQLSD